MFFCLYTFWYFFLPIYPLTTISWGWVISEFAVSPYGNISSLPALPWAKPAQSILPSSPLLPPPASGKEKWKKEEGRREKGEGRRKKEEGRRRKEGRRKTIMHIIWKKLQHTCKTNVKYYGEWYAIFTFVLHLFYICVTLMLHLLYMCVYMFGPQEPKGPLGPGSGPWPWRLWAQGSFGLLGPNT